MGGKAYIPCPSNREEEERLGTPAPPAACPEDPTRVTKEVGGPCQKEEVRDNPDPVPPTAGAPVANAFASASGGAQASAVAFASGGNTIPPPPPPRELSSSSS